VAFTVDGRPLTCKGAIARLEETFSRIPPDSLVRVLVNDVPSRVDVRAWADRKGHRIVEEVRRGDEFELLVAKGTRAMASGALRSSVGVR
jgi:TusA-related sulfurtransferase